MWLREHEVTNADYQKPSSAAMFYGRGDLVGEDILTKGGLLEMTWVRMDTF
jgi:hypothetical protein